MVSHKIGNIFESNSDVILHQVNCQGVMGSGVAKQVKDRYPWVYASYKHMCDGIKKIGYNSATLLGTIQPVFIDESRVIVNMFAQDKYGYDGCYTNYGALGICLYKIKDEFPNKKIAIPYLMGCHRGGGDWEVVRKMIDTILIGCDVTLYEFKGE